MRIIPWAVLITLATVPQQRTPQEILSDLDRLIVEMRAALTPKPDPTPNVITVAPGASVQAALDAAPDGATVQLTAGATYTESLRIRRAVKLTTAGANIGERRAVLTDAPAYARIVSPTIEPVLLITGSDVTVDQVIVSGYSNDLILCGRGDSSQTTLEQQPRRVRFDRLIIEGDVTRGAKRGIGLQCAEATVSRSHIYQIFKVGQDSSGIGGWNGSGPFRIEDNYISAASESILFGGADPHIVGLIPSDIVITGNTLTKDVAWFGQGLSVKNCLELKAARHVTIENNVLENVRTDAQTGWCIVFTPSQYGTNPGVTVENVTVTRNIIRNVGGGFNILGHGQNQSTRPTQRSNHITIRDNWVNCRRALGAHGALRQLGNGPHDLTIEWNTVECDGDAFVRKSDSQPIPGFRFARNLVSTVGTYGLFLAGSTRGTLLDTHMPGAAILDNAFVGAHSTMRANLSQNLYIATPDGLIENGYGVGAANGYGRRRQ